MPFKVVEEHFEGVLKILQIHQFPDDRGFFMELFRADLFSELGLPVEFVQWNLSRSRKYVLRGLHFQWEPPQGKLMRVARGTAFLVAVDLRKDSPTLGRWWGAIFREEEPYWVWAPASFARGFLALSDVVEVEYACTGMYNPRAEGSIRWDDPEIGISWPLPEGITPILSPKDREAMRLKEWLERPESEKFRRHPETFGF